MSGVARRGASGATAGAVAAFGAWGAAVLLALSPVATGPGRADPGDALNRAAQFASCLVEPSVTAALSTAVRGVLAAIHVEVGDAVAEGELIAELSAEVERATLANAEARAASEIAVSASETQLAFARDQLARVERLTARNTMTVRDLEEIQREVAALEAELARARLDRELASLARDEVAAALREKQLRSPVDGVVTDVALEVGEYVAEAATVIEVVRLDPLIATLYLPVEAFDAVRVGQAAEVRTEEGVARRFEATVTHKAPVVDVASGTFRVRLEFANPEGEVPSGLSCEVRFP